MHKTSARQNKIRERYIAGESMSQIARDFNISKQRVHQIISMYNKPMAAFLAVKPLVLDRDEHKCITCNAFDKLVVHHVDKNRFNNNPNNLQTLCSSCHARLHGQERLGTTHRNKPIPIYTHKEGEELISLAEWAKLNGVPYSKARDWSRRGVLRNVVVKKTVMVERWVIRNNVRVEDLKPGKRGPKVKAEQV